MAGNAINAAIINQQIAADAAYARGVYDWLKRKVLQYQTQFGATQATANATLTAAPYSMTVADAAQVTNLIVDFSQIAALIEGTAQTPPRDMRVDLATVTGIQ